MGSFGLQATWGEAEPWEEQWALDCPSLLWGRASRSLLGPQYPRPSTLVHWLLLRIQPGVLCAPHGPHTPAGRPLSGACFLTSLAWQGIWGGGQGPSACRRTPRPAALAPRAGWAFTAAGGCVNDAFVWEPVCLQSELKKRLRRRQALRAVRPVSPSEQSWSPRIPAAHFPRGSGQDKNKPPNEKGGLGATPVVLCPPAFEPSPSPKPTSSPAPRPSQGAGWPLGPRVDCRVAGVLGGWWPRGPTALPGFVCLALPLHLRVIGVMLKGGRGGCSGLGGVHGTPTSPTPALAALGLCVHTTGS